MIGFIIGFIGVGFLILIPLAVVIGLIIGVILLVWNLLYATVETKLAQAQQNELSMTPSAEPKKITAVQWIGYILLAPIVIPIMFALVILVGGILLSPIVCLFVILDLSMNIWLILGVILAFLLVAGIGLKLAQQEDEASSFNGHLTHQGALIGKGKKLK